MLFKEKVHAHYLTVLTSKIKLLQQKLTDLKEIGSHETKSTAGDKHETALAMVQIEQANTRSQLQEVLIQKEIFDKIKMGVSSTTVINGSLIKTDKGFLYLSIALGKISIDNLSIISLSPQSPLGIKLKGLTVGDVAEVNNIKYIIQHID
jgi:transcription elongation GreA/GreB family factor